MRIKPQREFYIPKGARKVQHKHSSAIVYAYEAERGGKPAYLVVAFAGRRQKPDFHYRYSSEAARAERVNAYFEAVALQEGQIRDRRAKPHELKAGDILRASWGYDQTNIDYYEVVRLIGKSMVEIQGIEGAGYEDGFMCGQIMPMPGARKGKVLRKRAEGNCVKIASYAYAYKMEPKLVAGVPVYESSRNSWYA